MKLNIRIADRVFIPIHNFHGGAGCFSYMLAALLLIQTVMLIPNYLGMVNILHC